MIMKNMYKLILGSLMTLGFTTASSFAQINPAIQQAFPPTMSATATANLGLVFTPNANISVNALGFYDTPGVTTGEMVGIYNSSGSLITSANVGMTGLFDSYFWQSITPVTLVAGQQYTVDAETGGNPFSHDGFPIFNPLITYGFDTYNLNSSLSFPTTTGAAPNFAGPDFSIAPSAVPDGGLTALLLGMSVASLGFVRRKLA